MHDNHERHQHIPPPDAPRDKDKKFFKPIHVVIGAVVLIAILLIYILQIAKAGY